MEMRTCATWARRYTESFALGNKCAEACAEQETCPYIIRKLCQRSEALVAGETRSLHRVATRDLGSFLRLRSPKPPPHRIGHTAGGDEHSSAEAESDQRSP